MELLIDRLNTLVSADVSRDEVLRQLNQVKPGLKKGEILANAQRLTGVFTTDAERRRAEEFLKDIVPLEESYVTSSGPLGTTREEVTVWDNPKKPMRFVGLMVMLSCIILGIVSYLLSGPNYLYLILIVGLPATIIVSTERAVVFNKWNARQALDKNIIRSAKSFELMLENLGRN
ncbi:MAG: hypothetical protein A3B86_03265 [Candidatus Yanofskybacteria bacterium RIFCSPHIGHO2_02_FULL_38_22b]|uniref:Uncharacterized protein n=1 Tax=Candidatus Yanofskybacteria bacterium RIFCSPHIGHO2_02_FULL_38_22b TaxID=1802673 RepID=A0A1F8F255_9BACT|nr:MAG: hypothetical protein A3B86_03265 [Candidatus Yanofskybacteria bacterium RIFCSPHIGHO2_02_FULL_38_22b]